MRYNPKAKLNDSQVLFRRGRNTDNIFYDRFDDKTRNKSLQGVKRAKQGTINSDAVYRRMLKRNGVY